MFPGIDIITVMIEGQPVPVAVVPVAILTPEREINPLPADSAVLEEGVLLLREKPEEQPGHCRFQAHRGSMCFSP